MALEDVNFQEGEGMDFILEIPLGTSNPPVDILFADDTQYPVMEMTQEVGGNIFIMSE